MVFGQACNLSKYIPPKKYLLDKVKIEGAPPAEEDQLYSLLKQVPNKKILWVLKLNMWSYLLANTEEVKQKRIDNAVKLREELPDLKAQLAKTDTANIKERQKLEAKIVKIENRIDYYDNREENLKKSVWEEPVILDSQLMIASAVQFRAYLFNKGYFYDSVSYSIKTKGKKATIIYKIKPGPPSYIHKLDYYVFDKRISDIVTKDSLNRLLFSGQKYDGDLIAQERNRITLLLRENGYYNFRRDYIYFEIDSSLGDRKVNVGIGISNPALMKRHRLYKIGEIYVEPEYYLNDTTVKDTFTYARMHFISTKPRIKASVLRDFIFLHKNDLYKGSDYQATINRLSQLNAYRFVDIQYDVDTFGRKDTGVLNVFIKLTPFKLQEIDLGLEFNSTEESLGQISTTRSLGSAGNFVYRNKNIGHSALQLEIKPQGSIEIPISILQHGSAIDTPSYQYGITNSLILPQLLVPHSWLNEKALKRTAQTTFNLNYIVENSRYFKRTTATINTTYQENFSPNFRLFVTPVEISLVNTGFVNNTFYHEVLNTHNPLLINLFDQHLITDIRGALLFNQQPLTNVKNRYWYLRISAETGGDVPAIIDLVAFNKPKAPGASTNQIFGINYYEYSKIEADFHYYIPVRKDNNLAMRVIAGLGTPLSIMGILDPNTKSTILPFEKQFYVGGANSIRAWRLRTLGPGSYKDNSPSGTINYDKSGDIKLEASAEYRVPIYSILKGALFVDAGNVWLYNDDPKRPGSAFHFNSFYKEIAIGTGIGARLDFNFFVIRLDFAVPLHDPSYPESQRWRVDQLLHESAWWEHNLQINLGIGYPF
jgi:outer membrane protein insertion porin family